MSTLHIRHFGPVSVADVIFSRFTFFVGPQGAGKSTIAKLYSMFMWLEKSLIRGMLKINYIEQYSRFQKAYCGYHRLSSYFYDDTVIRFIGKSYMFVYENRRLTITPFDMSSTDVAKVMYVPSERNFLSSLDNLSGLKSLPLSLQTFKDEYDSACKAYGSGYNLPINGVRYEYDRLNSVSWLVGNGFRVRLSDASSGFQAALPMLLVTNYLTSLVSSRHEDGYSRLSIAEQEKLNKEVQAIIDNTDYSPEVRSAALAALSSKFVYSGFVNVVEEPEENLYPESQKNVLFSLISNANSDEGNQLVVTTHSPYVINYLTLAVKACELKDMAGDNEHALRKISEIVPLDSCIPVTEISIYEMIDGSAEELPMPDGLPTDNNFLNMALGNVNNMFDALLEIEEEIQ